MKKEEENIWRRVIFGQQSKRGTGKEREEHIWSVEQNTNAEGKYLENDNTYLDSGGEEKRRRKRRKIFGKWESDGEKYLEEENIWPADEKKN